MVYSKNTNPYSNIQGMSVASKKVSSPFKVETNPYKEVSQPSVKPGQVTTTTSQYKSNGGGGYSASSNKETQTPAVTPMDQQGQTQTTPTQTYKTQEPYSQFKQSSQNKMSIASQYQISPGQPLYVNIDEIGGQSQIYTSTNIPGSQKSTFTSKDLVIDSTGLATSSREMDTSQRTYLSEFQRSSLRSRDVNPFREMAMREAEQGKSVDFRLGLENKSALVGGVSDLSRDFVERPVFGATELLYKVGGTGLNKVTGFEPKSRPGSYLSELETIRTESWRTTLSRGEIQEAGIATGLLLLTGGTGNVARGSRTLLGGVFVAKGSYDFLRADSGRGRVYGAGEIILGGLAIPKEFRPVKFAETRFGDIGKVQSVGLDFGTRSQPLFTRLKTPSGSEFSFFGRGEFSNKVNLGDLKTPIDFPETSLGGKEFLRSIEVSSGQRSGVKSLLESGKILGGEKGISVTDYVTRVEGVENRVAVSRAVEEATFDKVFGVRTRTSGVIFGTEASNPMLPKGYGNLKSGDIDILFPRKNVGQIGSKLGRLTEKLNLIEGKGVFEFRPDENSIFFKRTGKKFLEAKSGKNQDVLGLEDVAPSRVGGLSMERYKVVSFGRTKAVGAGQQFIRKISGSLISSPGGRGSGETASFSEAGILGKNVAGNPRGLKDVADAFSVGEGLINIKKTSSKPKDVLRASRAEKELKSAFENLYSKEQQRDILLKRTERTGMKFELETTGRGLLDTKISPSGSSLSSASLFSPSSVSSVVSDFSRGSKVSSSSSSSLSRSSSSLSKSAVSSISPSPSISPSLFSPRSLVSKSPSPSPSPSFSSFLSRSPSPSPSPPSPSPSTSKLISPISSSSRGGSEGSGSVGLGFGLFKKTKLKSSDVYVLPDLASVSATELALARKYGGGEARAPKLTKDIYTKAFSAFKGYGVGFIPTEQMRVGRIRL